MRPADRLVRVLALAGGLLVAGMAGAQSAAPAPAPAKSAPVSAAAPAKGANEPADARFKLILEPKAMDLLKAVSDKLAAAKAMSFTAIAGYEYPSKLGPPIVYSTRYDTTMQRPDRLRILIPGDGPASEFYYDGKTMVAFAPSENLAAVTDAPPTIDKALEAAFKNAQIFFPFEDLLVANPYDAMTTGAILAFYIGPSIAVGGTKTDMVAWASNDVFLQIWIGADDKLPRRIRAMFRADPLALRHEVDFSDWRLDPPVSAEMFASARAQTAGRMDFAAPAPPPTGVAPIVKPRAQPAPGGAPASPR
jgi:hypothetical protein